MNAKLSLAVIAATLAAAPAAMAQTYGNSYQNDASRSGYERSSPSGLPTTSPQVRSLPGEQADPWDSSASRSQTWNSPSSRAQTNQGQSYQGMSGSSSTVGNSTGAYGSSGNTSGSAGRVVGPAGSAGAMGQGTMHHNAQPYGTTSSNGMSGSTGTMGSTSTMGSTGDMQGNRQVLMNVDPNVKERSGRGQNQTELMQTSLLNYFSAAGFTSVRDFRKQGQNYVAEAQDRDGRWSTVELDPRTGTIASVR